MISLDRHERESEYKYTVKIEKETSCASKKGWDKVGKQNIQHNIVH